MAQRPKLIRVTTIPNSLHKLLRGQLKYMSQFFLVSAVSSPGKFIGEIERNENIDLHQISMSRGISPFQDIVSLIRMISHFSNEKPDIVHSHTPKAGLIAMLAAWICRVPIRLHTVAGLPLEESTGSKKSLLLIIERFIYKLCSKVYPNSYGIYDFISKHNLCDKKKLAIIGNGSSNGIDLTYFKRDKNLLEKAQVLRGNLMFTDKNIVFGFLGRIAKDKGIEELVKSFTSIAKQHPNVRLLLVGPEDATDSISSEVRDTIEKHSQIESIGYQEDVRPFLLTMDIFVFPSYREGLPNVVLQAGSMELPVIGTKINGTKDIICENENGLLVEPKNIESLKSAMLELYLDKEKRRDLARKLYDKVYLNYNRDFIWKNLKEEYSRLLTRT